MRLNNILKNKKQAFTLAEVVIVMGILGVMMAAFAPVVTKKTLAAGANTFRNFTPTSTHVGISYGVPEGEQTVIIGDSTFGSASYKPKLLVVNAHNNIPQPQIAFGTYDKTEQSRSYMGQILVAKENNIYFGGSGANQISLQNKKQFTALGMDACSTNVTSEVSNVLCLGYKSGGANLTSNSIYIGNNETSYDTTDIHFGSRTLSDIISHGMGDLSDIRLKNVGKEFTVGLDEINQLTFYNYTYKRDIDKDPKVGVMAQDLQKVFPNAVKENKDGYLYIRKDEMFYAALNAIKELGKMFTTNDEKIKALEERNAMLEKQNKELQDLYIELSKRVEKLDKKKTKGKLTITPEKEVEEEVIDPEFTLKSESTENSEE